jgi:hypothetical protein
LARLLLRGVLIGNTFLARCDGLSNCFGGNKMTNFFDLLSCPMSLTSNVWEHIFTGLDWTKREWTFAFFLVQYSMIGHLFLDHCKRYWKPEKKYTNFLIAKSLHVLTIPIYPVALFALVGMAVTGISHAVIEGIKESGKQITEEWKK